MAVVRDIIVGVDLGGTSLRALVLDRQNKTLAEAKTPTRTPAKPRKLIAQIADLVKDAVMAAGLDQGDIGAVSLGVAGAVDPVRGVVHEAPSLGLREVPLASELERLLRVPVLVENDVNVGVVGEHALGAAQGAQDVVGIFVGTGIGGGIISRGALYDGWRGAAGEVGHMVLQMDGPLCACGRRGCVQALASRTAMERDVRARIKAGAKSVMLKIMREHHRPRMTSSIIARALKKKDPVMRKVMKRAQHYLGILVANVVNLLDPECVVIGGGIVARLGENFVKPIREVAVKHFLYQGDTARVRIVAGSLGDNAGTLGAVVLARQRLNDGKSGRSPNPKGKR